MAGFTRVHSEEEEAARERGLDPFRAQFTILMHELKPAKQTREDTVVIACERKAQGGVTEPKAISKDGNNIFCINESIQLCLVLARRGNYGNDGMENADVVESGPSLPGFETVMARISVRKKNSQGTVLDCAAVNLAQFIAGRRSSSRLELPLQLGGTLSLSVKAQVFGEIWEIEANPQSDADGNKDTSDDEDTKEVEAQPPIAQPPSSPNSEKSEVFPQSTSEEGKSSDSGKERSKTIVSPDRLLSFCTAASDCERREEGDKDLEGNEEETENEEEECGPLRRMKTTRTFVGEYKTPYSEGVWKEEAVMSKVEAPNGLIFWNIRGPDEYEDDDDDDDTTDGEGDDVSHKKKGKKQPTFSVTTTKPGPPAKPGKISRLQKSCMTLEKPGKPTVIELGAPISLTRACVLKVTKYLAQDIQYIDEPQLSESDTEDDEDEDDDEEVTTEEECEANEEKNQESLPGERVRNYRSSSSGSGEDDKAKGFVDITKQEEDGLRHTNAKVDSQNVTSAPEGTLTNDAFAKLPSMAESDDRVGELTFQLHEMEKYIRQLQDELKSALRENAASLEQISKLEQAANIPPEDNILAEPMASKSSSPESEEDFKKNRGSISSSSGAREAVERELEAEKKMRFDTQRENERLLEVILMLKGELDREPESPDLLKELSEAKMQLAEERAERERLEIAVAKMKGGKDGKKKGLFGIGGGKGKSSKCSGSKDGKVSEKKTSPKSVQG